MKFWRLIAAVISVMKRGFFKLINVIRESKLVCCDCLVVMDDSRMSSCIKQIWKATLNPYLNADCYTFSVISLCQIGYRLYEFEVRIGTFEAILSMCTNVSASVKLFLMR